MEIKTPQIKESLKFFGKSEENLEELNLFQTDIAGEFTPIFYEDLEAFPTLSSLCITKGQITDDVWEILKGIPHLRRLSLRKCEVYDFSALSSFLLEELEIDDIHLKEGEPDCFDTLPDSLKVLALTNEILPSLSFLKKLPSLENLSLAFSEVKDGVFVFPDTICCLDLSFMEGLPSLKEIHFPASLEKLTLNKDIIIKNKDLLSEMSVKLFNEFHLSYED